MKEIIKQAIIEYILTLIMVLSFISAVAIIQANVVFEILWYTFLIFSIGEVSWFVLTRLIKYIITKI